MSSRYCNWLALAKSVHRYNCEVYCIAVFSTTYKKMSVLISGSGCPYCHCGFSIRMVVHRDSVVCDGELWPGK